MDNDQSPIANGGMRILEFSFGNSGLFLLPFSFSLIFRIEPQSVHGGLQLR
jgi:hypothetical protein